MKSIFEHFLQLGVYFSNSDKGLLKLLKKKQEVISKYIYLWEIIRSNIIILIIIKQSYLNELFQFCILFVFESFIS